MCCDNGLLHRKAYIFDPIRFHISLINFSSFENVFSGKMMIIIVFFLRLVIREIRPHPEGFQSRTSLSDFDPLQARL